MLGTTIAKFARALAAAALALSLGGLIPISAQAMQGPPDAVVNAYYGSLVNVMKNAQSLGFEGRYNTLEPKVKDTFDLEFIARYAIRGFWDKLTPEQQANVVSEFARLSTATYAARFKDYTGEQFKVLGSESTDRNDRFVRTQIVRSNGNPVAVNYLLRKRGDEWRIIDVYLKGTISELAKWRADFSAVMSRQGYDGLMAAIDQKIKSLKAE